MAKYFRVKNWEQFQHYKDRCPPWIKLASDTFQNYEFACLQDASKLLALCIWTLASRSTEGVVPADFNYLKRQGNLGEMIQECHLLELIDQGFIIDDSNALASCKQNACLETETETETETEISITSLSHPPPEKVPKIKLENFSEGFLSFWQLYPKNGASKAEAWKSYQQHVIKGGIDYADIERGVTTYTTYLSLTGTPTAHATTWLNQKRWTVDYLALAAEEMSRKSIGFTGKSSEPMDRRDPAARARDSAEEIIAKRRAERIARGEAIVGYDTPERQSGGLGSANNVTVPNLRIATHLRRQGENDGIP